MPCAMTWQRVWSGERMMSCSCRMSGRCMIMACVMGVLGFGVYWSIYSFCYLEVWQVTVFGFGDEHAEVFAEVFGDFF